MCFWFRKATVAESSRNNPSDPIQEGDLHSGPNGYSPNIAYTETQYGSRFDEDASWNEEEN